MAWEFKQGIPIYQQLVRRLELSIAAGEYAPDEKIPSVRELALEAGVNPNTMQRALSELVDRGLLYSERTSGRFVSGDATRLKQLRQELAEGYVADLFHNLQRLGMSRAEIDEAVHAWADCPGTENNDDVAADAAPEGADA